MTEDVRDFFNPPDKENKTICNLCSQSFEFDWDGMVDHLKIEHEKNTTADNAKSYIQKVAEERIKFTPKTGYNVVVFDDFEEPGEKLSLLEHFETKEEAEKFAKENSSEEMPVYVYGPEDEE